MTLTLVRHKGVLKPFGRLLAMKMLLAKNKQQVGVLKYPVLFFPDRCILRCTESAQQTQNDLNSLK